MLILAVHCDTIYVWVIKSFYVIDPCWLAPMSQIRWQDNSGGSGQIHSNRESWKFIFPGLFFVLFDSILRLLWLNQSCFGSIPVSFVWWLWIGCLLTSLHQFRVSFKPVLRFLVRLSLYCLMVLGQGVSSFVSILWGSFIHLGWTLRILKSGGHIPNSIYDLFSFRPRPQPIHSIPFIIGSWSTRLNAVRREGELLQECS